MDLPGPGGPEHADDLPGGRSPDDGVIHQHHPASLQDLPDRIQLDLHAEVPDGFLGLDEGPPHVVTPHDPVVKGDARALGVPQGGIDARVGDRHHDVRLDRSLLRQKPPQLLPDPGDLLAEDEAVRPGEVHVLEDAGSGRLAGKGERGVEALPVNADELPRLDVPNERGLQQIEGAGLGRQEVPVLEAAEREGAEPPGVPDPQELVLVHQDQGVGAPDLAEGLDRRLHQAAGIGAGDQVEDDLGVRGRGEHRSLGFQLSPEGHGVQQVAVVGDGDRAMAGPHQEGLGILELAAAGGGVADVANGQRAGEAAEAGLGEDVRDQPHGLLDVDGRPVGGRDPGRLLPSVLKGMEPQVGDVGGLGVSEDPEDPAFLPEFLLPHVLPRRDGRRNGILPDARSSRKRPTARA